MTPLTMPVLVGEGLRLRPFTVADTAPVIAAGRDPLIPWITTVAADGDQAAALEFVERHAVPGTGARACCGRATSSTANRETCCSMRAR